MRGSERRLQAAAGRRSSDQAIPGLPSWARVLTLALTLAVAVYVLLIARETARPERDADAVRSQALQQDARLLAAVLDGRIAAAGGGLSVAEAALTTHSNRPLDAAEAARAPASRCGATSP